VSVVVTMIGIASAIGTTAAWLPQVVKCCRTGSANDFSWGYLAMFASGVAGWIVYGALQRDAVIVAANAVTLVLVLAVVVVKMRDPGR
jgi:MtN3 and saliva related transmembrane protein